MWRGFSSGSVTVVLALSMLWGECAPCQQLLAAVQPASNRCCDSKGKCKTPQSQTPLRKPCQSPTAVLAQYEVTQPDHRAQVEVAPVVAADIALDVMPVVPEMMASLAPSPPGYTPPDLYTLHSTFLI